MPVLLESYGQQPKSQNKEQRGEEGGGWGGVEDYTSAALSPPERFCIQVGSGASLCNVS